MEAIVPRLGSPVRCRRASLLLAVLALGSAGGCIELGAAPPTSVCAPVVPPLDRPHFAGVELTRAAPAPAAPGFQVIAPAAFADNVRTRLTELPYFTGGSGPVVSLALEVGQFESGSAGCGALWIPTILLWPGYMLFGGPFYCYRVDVEVTWTATVGGFERAYVYEITDYSVASIYYLGEVLGPGDVYLGHTLWAMARQLPDDYAAFQRGELPARPEPFEDSLDGDDGDWYDPLEDGERTCPGAAEAGLGAGGVDIEMAVWIGLFTTEGDPVPRINSARLLGVRAAQTILAGVDGPMVAQAEAALADPAAAISDPELQAAADEALGRIRCARECVGRLAAGDTVDCAVLCNLTGTP